MRFKPAASLLLLALSSIVFAAPAGLTGMDSGLGSSAKGALGGMSCLADPKNIASVAVVLVIAVGVIRKKNPEGAGLNIATALTPILGIFILIQAAMSGALCKSGETMYLVMAFAFLQTLGEGQTSSKNPLLGIINMIITISIFQYILNTPSIMNNSKNLMGVLFGQVILTQALNSAGGSISFSGFGGSIWNGLKGLKGIRLRGPRGEDTKQEAEKEVNSKLKEVQHYIKEMEKKANTRIDHERTQARNAAKTETRLAGLKKRGKYKKIEQNLFTDADELTLLAKDLQEDEQAIAKDVQNINNFEATLRNEIAATMGRVVSFIKKHQEEQVAQFTNKAYLEGHMLDEEMTNLKEIRTGFDKSFTTTLNGIVFFAKLSVLMETSRTLLNVAGTYLNNTKNNLKSKQKLDERETKKQSKDIEKIAKKNKG